MNFYDDIGIYGDAPAIITEASEVVTYAELTRQADAVAACLVPRSVVIVQCDNSAASVAGYLGCLRAGAVPLLIGVGTSARRLQDLSVAYEPEFLWLPAEHASHANPGHEVRRQDGYVLMQGHREQRPAVHEALAILLTTSGSTGSPALVRLSHENINSNAAAIAEYLDIRQSDRPITTLPMNYTFGLSVIHSHLLRGCAIILSNRSIVDRAFWEQFARHQATTFSGVPYTLEMLKKLGFASMQLPSLQTMTQAGGKLGVALTREFATACAAKGVRFFVMYGQAEASPRMSYVPSELALAKAGSIGIPIPGGELWIEDDRGHVVDAPEVEGELAFRGPNVSLGYAECRQDLGRGDDNQGVLKTGDLARRDAEGFYYITGRKKRFLKMFGNRVNLDDVERLLGELGYSCACSGTDDHLQIHTTSDEAPQTIRRIASEQTGIHVSAFEVIHRTSMPRNESGKILYSALS